MSVLFLKNSFHGFVACPLVGLVLLLKLWIPSFPCLIERLIRLGFLLGCGLIACGKYEGAAAHFYLRLIELDYLNKKVCVAYLCLKKKNLLVFLADVLVELSFFQICLVIIVDSFQLFPTAPSLTWLPLQF